jgi:hypothetical protein
MLAAWISFALVTSALIISVKFGEGPEKCGGLLIGFMICFSSIHDLSNQTHLDGIDVVGFGIDFVGFAGFFGIALFANRIWPLWVAALQLVAVCAHLVHELNIQIDPMAYALMRYSPTSLASAVLLASSILLIKRSRSNGSKDCWRDWSALSNPNLRSN